ncbi:MAG: hypothetical protein ACJAT2_002360 [Bacteriovoracaceae bacterium]|jgi:hypothetical protein
MRKLLIPLAIIAFLGMSCEKQSLEPTSLDNSGVSSSELRSSEALLNKEVLIKFEEIEHKPAPGLQPIKWKVSYLGKKTITELSRAHSYLVEYIINLQDFLELYPVEQFYYLGVHEEFITKLQSAMVLKQELETGIEKLNNANLERSRYQMLQKVFEDMDLALSEKGMKFEVTEDSILPIITIGKRKKKAKALRDQLKLYIADGEDLLLEANSEYSLLEAGKIEVAKVVLQKINDRLDKSLTDKDENYLDKEFEFIN